MPEVLISDIKVDAAERQRTESMDPKYIEELAHSISEYGLLEPVLLDNDNNLVAGFCRLTAHIMLGADKIKAEYLGQLDPVRAQEIELEENVRRKQLTWQEESKAIEKIHGMKMANDPLWTADKTAEALGISRRKVFNSLELAKAIEQQPEVAKADTQQGAMLRLSKSKQITERVEAAKVRELGQNLGLVPRVNVEIRPGDALASLRQMADSSADAVISNPPYGVDIEAVFIGDRTIYEDAEKDVVPMLREVVKEVYRILKDDRWFVWFYPTARLEEGKAMLTEAGFKFQQVPCVWYKPNKFLSSLSNPYQNFSSQYETFFWARKGDPKLNRLRVGNVFVWDTPQHGERLHPLQMPVGLWKEIIEAASVEGELVIEPFSGSGSGGVACVELNRSYIGLELSDEYVTRARTWINEALTGSVPPTSAKSAQPIGQKTAEAMEALKSMEF